MYDKAAHQHRRNCVAGDAQCHHGDQRAAAHRIICTFRCDDTLRTAGAELLRLLGGILCLIICHQCGRALAHSRQYADQCTDNGGNAETFLQALECTLTGQDSPPLIAVHLIHGLAEVLQLREDLTQCKQTHQNRHLAETATQAPPAKGEALQRGQLIHADHRQHHADNSADQSLNHIIAAQGDDHRKAHNAQREILPRSKHQTEASQLCGHKNHDYTAEQAADQAGRCAVTQRPVRMSVSCHG